MDLFGPTTYKSLGGNLYCLVIVDDYSRYTWVFFLHDKTEVAACFKKFVKRAQNEFEVKHDPEILVPASAVLGHLAKAGGAMTADEVERQVSYIWLRFA